MSTEERKILQYQLDEILNEDEDYNVEEEYKLYMDEYNNDFVYKFDEYVG